MIIGFDAKRVFSNFTGLGNYSRTLLWNLSHFFPEISCHLYTPSIGKSEHIRELLYNSTHKVHLPASFFKSYWRSYSIGRDLKRDRVELFHGLSHEIPYGIKSTAIKSIVTIHDLIFRVYPKTYPWIDRVLFNAKVKHACHNADRIIAISENTKKDIIEHYSISPNKIDVAYQSCSPLFFRLRSDDENAQVLSKYGIPDTYLLYVGTIEERKNLKTLIEAYNFLPSSFRIPVVVIGKGKSYKKECMELVRSRRLEGKFLWINHLTSNSDLQSIYQCAQALVYPSIYEGFGLPVAEALLCKTPVITSNVSSLPEAGGPSSLYVDPRSPNEIAVASVSYTHLTLPTKRIV